MIDWSERFERFVSRKAEEASGARLSAFATDVDRATDNLVRIGSTWSEALFDGPFYVSPAATSEQPAASLVFVQSRDGNTGAADPSALGGGDTDKHLIYEGLSRVAADAVLAGADTVRGGDVVFSVWHPELVALRAALGHQRHPVQIVGTLRGIAVESALLFNVPELRVILITVGACANLMHDALAARPWITPIVIDKPTGLPMAFTQLRRMGIERISAVGGRSMARALIDGGLVQDLYLTTSPVAGGEPNTPLYPKPLPKQLIVRKHGEGGIVFAHSRIGEAGEDPALVGHGLQTVPPETA